MSAARLGMVALLFVVMGCSHVRTLKRSKLVALSAGKGGDEGAGSRGAWLCVARL